MRAPVVGGAVLLLLAPAAVDGQYTGSNCGSLNLNCRALPAEWPHPGAPDDDAQCNYGCIGNRCSHRCQCSAGYLCANPGQAHNYGPEEWGTAVGGACGAWVDTCFPILTAAPSPPPPTTAPAMPGTIQAATAILAANLTELAAGLAAGGAAEPAWVAEVLTVAADGVSVWLAEVAEVAEARAGSGAEEPLAEELEAFGQAQELASNLTLLAAAALNTSVVSQGTSADGKVILTSVHTTLDSDMLAYPFFGPGFTGAAACLQDTGAAAGAEASPCLRPAVTTADTSGDASTSSDTTNTMTLPAPRVLGATGASSHVGFVLFTSPRFAGASVGSNVLSATVAGLAHNTPFGGAARVRFNLTAGMQSVDYFGTGIAPCVFWNERGLNWSSTGCEYLGTAVGSVVMCECDHLTSFAVLADANAASGAGSGLSVAEQHGLTWFVYACVGISIGCLTAVILVYTAASELRTETKVILVHLCIVYDLALILFLATATNNYEGDGCTGVGAMLHFALLSTFLWMLVEGHHLHQTFVNVFSQRRAQEGRQLAVYCGAAYGVPAVWVLLLVLLWPAAYERDDGFCFLSKQTGAIWFFLGPALVVITLNIYVLVQVSREVWDIGVMRPAASDSRTSEIIAKAKRAAKSSLAFGSILGITWVFGLLSLIMPSSVAFHYLFAVCNALGGLWIFGFHLLMDPEVGKRARRSTFGALLGPGKGKRKTKDNFLVVRRRKGGTLDKDIPHDLTTTWSGTDADRSSVPSAGASHLQGSVETAETHVSPSDRPAPGSLMLPVSRLPKAVVNPVMEHGAMALQDLTLPVYVHPPSEERGDWAADPEQRVARSATMETLWDPEEKLARTASAEVRAHHVVVQEGEAGLPKLSSLSEPVETAFNVPDAAPAAADAVFAALQARVTQGAHAEVAEVTEADPAAGDADDDWAPH